MEAVNSKTPKESSHNQSCVGVNLSINILIKENKLIEREISGLKNKKKYLIKKLKELQRSITLSGNIEKMIGQDIPSLNFVQKNSLEEYLMQNKIPSSLFDVIKDREHSISYLLQTGIYVPNYSCECTQRIHLKSNDRAHLFYCACGKEFKFFDRGIWADFDLSPEKLVLFILL